MLLRFGLSATAPAACTVRCSRVRLPAGPPVLDASSAHAPLDPRGPSGTFTGK
jgi:hypothetical protein